MTGHCAGCGARLRREKPSWASCDPCQDAADRRAYDKAWTERLAREAAANDPRLCKHCGAYPVLMTRGVYAWLCSDCREDAREEARLGG